MSSTRVTTKSQALMARARELFPGGVNSPVRAFGGVGGPVGETARSGPGTRFISAPISSPGIRSSALRLSDVSCCGVSSREAIALCSVLRSSNLARAMIAHSSVWIWLCWISGWFTELRRMVVTASSAGPMVGA